MRLCLKMNYKLELSEQEINVILGALGEMPANIAISYNAKVPILGW